MKLRFWGTRGSLAMPGPATVRYGGNTACVELRTEAGTLIIFDCGTGAHELGLAVLESHPTGVAGAFLLGHTHWDHIQGFPFFGPLFQQNSTFTIYAPTGGDGSRRLSEVLAGQMEYTSDVWTSRLRRGPQNGASRPRRGPGVRCPGRWRRAG